jgi:hypothetical protein
MRDDQRNHGPGPRLWAPAERVEAWELFPNALRAIAQHSVYGSKKHNPGEPVNWAFRKSTSHVEKAIGHLRRAGQTDDETGRSHTINAAWRAVAALETELIAAGALPGPRVRDVCTVVEWPNVELGGVGE